MFFHSMKYNLLTALRTKITLFWTLIFPIALATFMHLAFGNIFESTEQLKAIPVAIVNTGTNEIFTDVIEELSKDGEDSLLAPEAMDETQAQTALDEEEVFGIIYVDENVALSVKQTGIEQTVLSTFMNQYVQTEATLMDIAENNPQNMPAALEKLQSDSVCYEEIRVSEGSYDFVINFFYAIFAMSCLFASYTGITSVLNLQANLTTLGARRSVAPTKKSVIILSQYVSNLFFQFTVECIAFAYMKWVLGIDFGTKYAALLLILLLGCSAGLALGMFIGALPKPKSENAKMGLGTAVSMTLSVMADLCSNGIQDAVEHTAPILNRINPATLITDSFYALNTFENYSRFARNMSLLGIITAVLLTISILMIRRNRYASI